MPTVVDASHVVIMCFRFMDDVMFSYDGAYDGVTLRQQPRYNVYTG